MNSFTILTDSTCDMSLELIKRLNVEVIPFEYSINGNHYLDVPTSSTETKKDFYDQMRNGASGSTSQVSPERYKEFIKPYLEKNNNVLFISFSSGLSGSFNSLRIAREDLLEEFSDVRFEIFDSLCASCGEALMVFLASQKRNEGASIDEVLSYLNDIRLKIAHRFTVDDLEYLRRGGRLSKATAFIGKTFHIKPLLHVTDEGKLVAIKKSIGRKASLRGLFDAMVETGVNLENQTIFISHCDCLDEVLALKERIEKEISPKEIIINEIGPVIGSHSGPGTIALFFIATHR